MAATIPPFRKGRVPAVISNSARLLENVAGQAEQRSGAAPKRVRLRPRILFAFSPESRSPYPGFRTLRKLSVDHSRLKIIEYGAQCGPTAAKASKDRSLPRAES